MSLKFQNKTHTLDGTPRASVRLNSLKTLWFNTGTLCNLACANCYIESSPKNDSLVYITAPEVEAYLQEIKVDSLRTNLIGFTGGEPFLNPNMIDILHTSLEYGHDVLVLTNGYRILKKHLDELVDLKETYRDKLHLRISLDHYTREVHEEQRGPRTFDGAIKSLKWLYDNEFNISIAGRSLTHESSEEAVLGYQYLLSNNEINVELTLGDKIVIFPEMEQNKDVPEISVKCWDILGKSPDDQMCASERMIVKRKGEGQTKVLACTLLAYDKEFELGETLKNSDKEVFLNHRFCSEFCVLGGASCSSAK